jgi:hypothetical protein
MKLHRDEVSTDCIYFAGLLWFLGYSLLRIEVPLDNKSTFYFAVPQLDWDELNKQFEAHELAITDLKQYMFAMYEINKRARDAKAAGGIKTWRAK